MKKNGFTIIEVVIVFMLILGVTFLILPKSLDNTKHAKFISKWSAKYSEIEYMFSVINAQEEGKLQEKFKKAQNNDDKREIVIETVKPFLRISSEAPADYSQKYMDGIPVGAGDQYHFDKFYNTSSNEIVGIKWIAKKCEDKMICALMSFDINGTEEPNTWGYDIFGINLLKGAIEPIGKNYDEAILKNNCSKSGSGIYCSYYYLIGGKFD